MSSPSNFNEAIQSLERNLIELARFYQQNAPVLYGNGPLQIKQQKILNEKLQDLLDSRRRSSDDSLFQNLLTDSIDNFFPVDFEASELTNTNSQGRYTYLYFSWLET